MTDSKESKESKKTSILVVDDEPDLREVMSSMLEVEFNADVIECDSGKAAIEALKKNPDIDLVICDYYLPNGNGGTVFQFMRECDLKIPFILVSSNPPQDYKEFRNRKISGYVEKPYIQKLILVIKQLNENIKNNTFNYDSEYCKIRLSMLLKMSRLQSDVYIKINPTKFIKVIHSGNNFDIKDLVKYKSKKIDFLYIKRTDRKSIMHFLLGDILEMASSPSKEILTAFDFIKSSMEFVQEVTSNFGWDSQVKEIVVANANLALNTFNEDSSLSRLLIQLKLEPQSYLASHSSLLAFVACGIASEKTWESEQTHYKLTLAAMIHDLTLTKEHLDNISHYNKHACGVHLTENNTLTKYINHPLEAAKLISTFKDIPSGVESILAQHHERPDAKGFPNRLSAHKISPLPAVFIVAEDLVDYLFQNGAKADVQKFLESHRKPYQLGVFAQVYDALIKALNRKD